MENIDDKVSKLFEELFLFLKDKKASDEDNILTTVFILRKFSELSIEIENLKKELKMCKRII